MTIAFCIFNYFPFGGLQKDFFRIATECSTRGHKIIVYTYSWKGAIPENFDIHLVPNKAITNHGKAVFYSKYMERELKKNKFDLVIGFNRIKNLDIYFAGDNCLLERYLTGKKFLSRLTPRFRVYSALEKVIFNTISTTNILILTEKQKHDYIKHYRTQEKRLHMLPPGISNEYTLPQNPKSVRKNIRNSLKINDDQFVLIQVGSGFKTKGLDRSLKAIASLPEHIIKKIIFLIVGKGNAMSFIKLSKKLKIEKQVRFLDGRTDVPELLLGADLMIHPSINESAGAVLTEAIAEGLPVLCTGACGYSNYIQKANAGIVLEEPFQQDKLNQKLLELINNKNELKKMSENAINFVKTENFYIRHKVATDIIEKLK